MGNTERNYLKENSEKANFGKEKVNNSCFLK